MSKIRKKIIIVLFLLTLSPINLAFGNNALDTGLRHFQNENYKAAKATFIKAIKNNPDNYKANYYLAFCYFNEKDFTNAVKYLEKAYKINPDFAQVKSNLKAAYHNLAVTYKNKKQFHKAIKIYNKALEFNPDKENLYFQTGYCYSKLKNYKKAIEFYYKTLRANPNNQDARHNLQICHNAINNEKFLLNLNYSKPEQKAPFELYSQISLEPGVNCKAKEMLCEILDFLWNDVEGRIILTYINSNKIPIKITYGAENTNAVTKTRKYKKTLKLYGIIPLFTLDEGKERKLFVNIGEDYIFRFKDKNLHPELRLMGFQAVVHEFCHTIRSLMSENKVNSLEEEIVSSMIGYNIASRIFRKKNLTYNESFKLSKSLLKAALKDEHKNLPLYNGFSQDIQRLGIKPPYPQIYQNIPKLYRAIRNDADTVPYPKLDAMIDLSDN